jgi:hypothetical protein
MYGSLQAFECKLHLYSGHSNTNDEHCQLLWVTRMPSSGMWHRVALVRTDVSEECWFLQESHSATSQKMALFIVTAAKTSLSYIVGNFMTCQ